jgi:hypothetical protein
MASHLAVSRPGIGNIVFERLIGIPGNHGYKCEVN